MPNPTNFLRAALAALVLATSSGALLFAADAPAAAPATPFPTGSISFAVGIDPNEKVPQISFSDMEVKEVLTQLEWLTGRIIIRPQALPPVLLTLNAKGQQLTRADALVAFESLLSINGIGLAPLGDKYLKVVATGQIRSEAPELVVGSLRDSPPSGKIVSKLFRLQYLDPTSFQTQIAPFLSSFGFVVPFQNSNAVIVTDSVSNLQRLEYLVTEVDRRLNIETKFYPLHYSSATELAQSIKAMLDSARAGLTQGRPGNVAGQPVSVPQQPGQGGATSSSGGALQAVLSSSTSINADARTNQLIVITDPANLPFFDNLIEKLDIAADPPTSIEVFAMNYAKATELGSLLTSLITGRSQTTSTGGANATRRTTTLGGTNNAAGGAANRNAAGGLQTGANQNANQNAQQRAAAVQALVAGAGEAQGTQFSQYMTVVADDRTNSIVVSGTNSDLDLIRRIIEKLDVVLAQVRIEVVIAEVTLSKGLVRGIDAFNGHYVETSGLLTGTINPGQQANTLGGPLGATIPGTLAGGALRDITLDAVFNAARTNSNVNLLSVPTIVTTHNQPASILVGESRPIVTSTTSSLSNTGTTQSQVQYQDIPLQLDVTPVIGPNNVVQMEIHQIVNAVTDFVTVDANQQPVVSRREATSYVSVKDGQLIVLGGLQKTFNSRTKTKMFFFGELPLLGELFSRTNNQSTRTELLLFLKPTVLRNTDEADANARESVNKLTGNKEDLGLINEITGEHVGEKSEPPSNGPVMHRRP